MFYEARRAPEPLRTGLGVSSIQSASEQAAYACEGCQDPMNGIDSSGTIDVISRLRSQKLLTAFFMSDNEDLSVSGRGCRCPILSVVLILCIAVLVWDKMSLKSGTKNACTNTVAFRRDCAGAAETRARTLYTRPHDFHA